MVQYIVILLDDTSVSFCNYENRKNTCRLMPLDTLRKGIRFAMMENLNIQFVYPDYLLPKDYLETIDTIDHTDIKPFPANADVVVIDKIEQIKDVSLSRDIAYVLRLDKHKLFEWASDIAALLEHVTRLNIVVTDVETFTDADLNRYEKVLSDLSNTVECLYVGGKHPQINLLTDRMMLDKMNNCGAGDTSITLAPDGRFYVCPAFYLEYGGYSIGDLEHGLDIRNVQLYRLDHAPICRHCDAWQCKRCVWLNRKTTLEVNTPSHEQCVISHLERNASRKLLISIRQHGTFMSEREIKEIDYLDPFEKRKEW